MRHLITGGSGFVGNLVARRLRERGEEVRILDIWADPSRPKDIEYVETSVLNREGVAATMRGVDVVHHNAALVAQNQCWQGLLGRECRGNENRHRGSGEGWGKGGRACKLYSSLRNSTRRRDHG